MIKYFSIAIFLMFILATNYGCSFIKERFFKNQNNVQFDQEQTEEETEQESKPIPVNPSHS